MKRIAYLFSRLLIVAGSLAITLLILEVTLRVLDARPLPVKMGALWQDDEELGWVYQPDMEGWVTKPDDNVAVWVTINSHGWRGAEYSYERAENTRRILVLGDSYTAALEVELDETFHAVLETLLDETSDSVQYEVLNMGVSGYGTAQELITYRKYGRLYQPDIVLLAFVDNDVINNANLDPSRSSPTFIRDESGVLRWIPGQDRSPGRVESIKTWLRQHTRLYPIVTSYLNRIFLSVLSTPGGRQQGEKESSPLQEPYEQIPLLGIYQDPPPAQYEDAWDITEDLIQTLRQEVEADGACFAVVNTGGVLQQVDRHWERVREDISTMENYEWNRNGPTEWLTAFLLSSGIPFVDLSPIFRDPATQDLLRLGNDGHWNALGHKAAGEGLYDWMTQQRLLECEINH